MKGEKGSGESWKDRKRNGDRDERKDVERMGEGKREGALNRRGQREK